MNHITSIQIGIQFFYIQDNIPIFGCQMKDMIRTVEMALAKLNENDVVKLDEERKTAQNASKF